MRETTGNHIIIHYPSNSLLRISLHIAYLLNIHSSTQYNTIILILLSSESFMLVILFVPIINITIFDYLFF